MTHVGLGWSKMINLLDSLVLHLLVFWMYFDYSFTIGFFIKNDRHRDWLPSAQQERRVAAKERAASERVQIQTHPLPQEVNQTSQGRRHQGRDGRRYSSHGTHNNIPFLIYFSSFSGWGCRGVLRGNGKSTNHSIDRVHEERDSGRDPNIWAFDIPWFAKIFLWIAHSFLLHQCSGAGQNTSLHNVMIDHILFLVFFSRRRSFRLWRLRPPRLRVKSPRRKPNSPPTRRSARPELTRGFTRWDDKCQIA